ncbi:hypothetical protein ACLK1T_11180 [Escherichia coli]
MIKPVATLDDIFASRRLVRAAATGAVVRAYPASEKMGVRIQQYTGQKFITTMPETGNQRTIMAASLVVYSHWRRSPVGG